MTDSSFSYILIHRLWIVVVVCLFILSSAGGRVRADDISVFGAGCTEKIQDQKRSALQHDGVWDQESKTVRLSAVRGEHVPFQIVISTTRRNIKGINLSLSSFQSSEDELHSNHISLYLAHLVNVYTATEDHGSRGRWPDALVPLAEPFDMRFFWHSQSVNYQSVWIDIEIPEEQAPGIYRGSVAVSCNEGKIDQVEVELTIHDLQLPKRRSFPVHIGLYEEHIARMHGVVRESDEFNKIFEGYLRYLLENRFDPRTSPKFRKRTEGDRYVLNWERPDLEKLFLDKDRLQYWMSPVPDGTQRPHELPLPDSYRVLVRQHLLQVIEHAKAQGWYRKLGFHIPVDEPNSLEDYEAVREWAELIKSVDEQVRVSVTEQPNTENSKWGSLTENVDSWIINGNYLFSDRASIDARRRIGDQVLWYISCDQLHPQPNLYIDREAADPRMIPWISWQYQMSGFLYWNATYWAEVRNPWLDPVTWKTLPCNLPAAGEGSLLYPGNMARQYSGQPNVSGPIGTIRMALLQEGLEELELLKMLTEKIGRKEVAKIVSPICRTVREFSRDPNKIDGVREIVIRKLLELQPKDQ